MDSAKGTSGKIYPRFHYGIDAFVAQQYRVASYLEEVKMGHYGSEMEPEDKEKRAWEARVDKLYAKVKDMSLGCFKGSELPALLKFFGSGAHGFPANAQDVKMLEEAIARNEKILRSLPKK